MIRHQRKDKYIYKRFTGIFSPFIDIRLNRTRAIIKIVTDPRSRFFIIKFIKIRDKAIVVLSLPPNLFQLIS